MTVRGVFFFSLVALAWLMAREWEDRPITHAAGILVPETPEQSEVASSSFEYEGYQITRRAEFNIRARVLSSQPYLFFQQGLLSPVDLALGWGVMSDQALLDQLEISQSGRWYTVRFDLPAPVPLPQMMRHSSNMHMIPATASIQKKLKRARVGSIITLRGHLVDVNREDGWFWRTSLSREDTGKGACEIVFVESVLVEQGDL